MARAVVSDPHDALDLVREPLPAAGSTAAENACST
jgi:hypothetical protein